MGYMSKKVKNLSEEEIDQLVIAHADDDSAWEKPVRVRRSKSPSVPLLSEVPDSFLEQAERLLRDGHYAPAAVIAGSVLEDVLRRLCYRKNISAPDQEAIDLINVKLAKADAYNTPIQKRIAALLALSNKAARGNWSEFNQKDVELMIAQVRTYERLFRLKEQSTTLTLEEEKIAQLPIASDPEILSGAAVFRGTRVPVAVLLENLEAGLTLDEFLDNFPTVTREQALQVLEFSKDTIALLSKAA
jgi:uncharacterized protein (DUF433 family)/HEPN domain-containing protein